MSEAEKKKIKSLEERVSELETAFDESEREVQRMRDERDEALEELDEAEEERDDEHRKREEEEARADEAEEEVDALHAQVDALHAQVDALEHDPPATPSAADIATWGRAIATERALWRLTHPVALADMPPMRLERTGSAEAALQKALDEKVRAEWRVRNHAS